MDKQHADRSKHFIVPALILATGILFTAIQVQQSVFRGQLSLPITYDDIAYFSSGLRRLNRFYDKGLLQLILDYFQRPPHSSTSTFTIMFGFSVFGIRDWAPALANSIWIIVFLSFVAYVTSHLTWFYRVAIAIVILSCPLLGHLVVESRPDILCGLATASSAFLILQTDARENQKHQILIGILASLAFLAKPTISPITALILLSAVLFPGIHKWIQNDDENKHQSEKISPSLKPLAFLSNYKISALITFLIISPYYLFGFQRIFGYIYKNIFGADKELWQTNSPFAEQVTYYITGPGGKMMFGTWGIIALLAISSTCIFLILTKNFFYIQRSLPYAGVILITYLLVTIPKTKSPFLGMAFGGMILTSTLFLLVHVAQSLNKRRLGRAERTITQFVWIALVVSSLLTSHWPWFNKTGLPNAGSTAQALYERNLVTSLTNQFEKLATASEQCAPQIALTSEATYLNMDVLEYYLLKQGFTNFVVWVHSRSNKLAEHWEGISRSDYVVAFSLDNPTKMAWLPAEEVQSSLLNKLNSDPSFKLIQTFDRPASLGSGAVLLYEAEQPCSPLPPHTAIPH